MASLLNKIIKSLAACLLPVFFAGSLKAATLEPLSVRDFTCGLITTQDPTLIGDGCSQQLWNVDIWTGRLQTRRGSILQNSTDLGGFSNQGVKFLHYFPDQNGNFWLLSYSSNTLFTSSNGGAVNTILTSTFGLTASSVLSGVNAFGKAYLTDGTTNWLVYDGNSLVSSTAPPHAKLNAFMFGRIFAADVTGSRSSIYASRINDPNDWTNDALDSGDSFQEFIRQNDGYFIRALIPFKNSLLIFKDYSIDSLTMGNDGLTPIVTPISNNVGTQNPRSIVQTDNSVIFLGPDQFYEFTGPALNPISNGIKPTVDSILQKNSTSRSYSLTTQADFNLGTFHMTSASPVPGAVVLSTWGVTENSTTSFLAGTLVNMTTSYAPNSIALSVDGIAIDNPGFETGNTSSWTVAGVAVNTKNPHSGSYAADLTGFPAITAETFRIYNTSNVLQQETSLSQPGSYTIAAISFAPFLGQIIYFSITNNGSNRLTSEHFFCNGDGIIFFSMHRFEAVDGNYHYYYDDFNKGKSSITTASFVSQTFDTAISSPAWLPTIVSTVSNQQTLNWFTQASTDGINFEASQSWTPGSSPISSPQRYIRYIATIATATFGTGIPYIQSVSLGARSLSGDYLSNAIPIGTNITSWSSFQEDHQLNGGNITYTVFSDSDTSISTNSANSFLSSQTIVSGQIPTIATAPFFFVHSTMSITVSTFAPEIDALQQNWTEGSSNFPVWALYFEHEYHCAVSTLNISNNDTILVFDRNRAWLPYTGYTPYTLVNYRQGAYYGDATRGRIYHYVVPTALDDAGTAINALWRSKEYDFGYPSTDKTMVKFSLVSKRQVGTTLNFNYGPNRGAYTSSPLNLGLYPGFFKMYLVPPSLTYNRGVTHSFSITNNSLDQPFEFLAYTLYPRLETDPQ